MCKTNFEDNLYAIKDMLQDKVANYLDVNREHIDIIFLNMNVCGEDCYDWDEDPEDACIGVQNETYYQFAYRYRVDKSNLDYEEPVDMIWQHIEHEEENRVFDSVMTVEEFEQLFEKKKSDACSMLWYEEDKN